LIDYGDYILYESNFGGYIIGKYISSIYEINELVTYCKAISWSESWNIYFWLHDDNIITFISPKKLLHFKDYEKLVAYII